MEICRLCGKRLDMDVIVLGGGLMGTAATFFLRRRGLKVTLIERNRVGTGATVASFGNIRRTGRHLTQLPLAHRSRALWGDAERLLGRDVEFRATGHLRLIFEEDALADMRAYADTARPWGLELEELGANEIRARFPGLGPGAIAASFSPQDGSGNPRLIAPAFTEAARRLGAEIVEECEVGSIEKTESGFRVSTSKGVFEAAKLLNTAGAWGMRIAAQFGEPVPLTPRGPQMGVTEPLPHRILPVVGKDQQVAALHRCTGLAAGGRRQGLEQGLGRDGGQCIVTGIDRRHRLGMAPATVSAGEASLHIAAPLLDILRHLSRLQPQEALTRPIDQVAGLRIEPE